MVKVVLQNTNKWFVRVLKQGWKPIVIGAVLFEIPSQYFVFYQRFIQQNMQAGVKISDAIRLTNELCLGLVGMLSFGYLMLIVPIMVDRFSKNKAPTKTVDLLFDFLKPLTVETLRSMGRILLWSLLLVLPGLYYYMRYTFVPLVVVLSPAYRDGKVDALKLSDFLTRGFGLPISIYLIGSSLASYAASLLKDTTDILENPLLFIIYFALFLLVEVYFCVVAYFLYDYLFEIKKEQIPA